MAYAADVNMGIWGLMAPLKDFGLLEHKLRAKASEFGEVAFAHGSTRKLSHACKSQGGFLLLNGILRAYLNYSELVDAMTTSSKCREL
ncbi:uncharacterized protein LOC110879575 isoform X2 [Helianthus annuus]|uniref:uncharacterized protein LOC110879575 isoform X2 n=2 Tax=Helianthus annuus TaxID=4232 RepID=UPI000B8F394B|nr:uncharacterized protein LOC110879575 isoform X2 [Helianthus annuus]